VLEEFFATGQGTPSKPKIKEIADQLQEFGPITEPSVYNWFQNRKVRNIWGISGEHLRIM
jgi:hypothetical protein